MARILVIMNHEPTEEQISQLKGMGYDEIVYLKHPPIPAEAGMMEVEEIWRELVSKHWPPDALWVQGDYRLFSIAFTVAEYNNIPLYVATTERKAVEQRMSDGSIKKVSIFRHVRFVDVTEGVFIF